MLDIIILTLIITILALLLVMLLGVFTYFLGGFDRED